MAESNLETEGRDRYAKWIAENPRRSSYPAEDVFILAFSYGKVAGLNAGLEIAKKAHVP